MQHRTPALHPVPLEDGPPIVGLIANPLASKDIRRLVGLARVVDVEEKANLIGRFLVGLTAGPDVVVAALDDSGGIAKRGLRLTRGAAPPVGFLPIEARATEADTSTAARMLGLMGAKALVTVGGDGTIRSAVEGWPEARLVPLAAGTNNAMAIAHEPTIVGYATALAVSGGLPDDTYERITTMVVHTGEPNPSTAVVDAVGVRTHWTGARALWEPEDLVEAVVANARPDSVGVASISAALGPTPPGHARHIRFGPGRRLRVIFGPGLVGDVSVETHRIVAEGETVALDPATRVIALDGERRLVRDTGAHIEVRPGAHLLSIVKALERHPSPSDDIGSFGPSPHTPGA